MKFKMDQLKDEFFKVDHRVQIMAIWFEQLSRVHFNIEPTITRIFEAIKGSSGVHEAGRAVDFRDEFGGSFLYKEEQRKFLLSEMNKRFPRTDNKLSIIWHSFNGNPHHFHLQAPIKDGDLKFFL